jgi:hypothetical protein
MEFCQFVRDDDGIPICAICSRKVKTNQDLLRIHRVCQPVKPIPEAGILPPPNLPGPPNLARKLYNFSVASIGHFIRGNPTCTQEEIDERLTVCKGCELYRPSMVNEDTGICTHSTCGCNINSDVVYLNKLAWADQECPLKKWCKIERRTKLDTESEESSGSSS